MVNVRALTLAVLPLAIPSCTTKICNDGLQLSIIVRLRDVDTGNAICEADLFAQDGSYRAPLFKTSNCTFVGVPERPGEYEVGVASPGYLPANARARVTPKLEACGGVVPANLTIDLRRDPKPIADAGPDAL